MVVVHARQSKDGGALHDINQVHFSNFIEPNPWTKEHDIQVLVEHVLLFIEDFGGNFGPFTQIYLADDFEPCGSRDV